MQWFGRRGGLITASEIASFAYCPEQWRLEYGRGLPADNQAAMAAGIRHHEHKAAAERVAGWLIRLGQIIVVAALALFLLWVLSQ
jgi:hypothetical protein